MKMLTNKRTNESTELQQFRREPSYHGLNLIGHSVFELDSGKRNVDRQTNGHKTDKRMDRITPISKGT